MTNFNQDPHNVLAQATYTLDAKDYAHFARRQWLKKFRRGWWAYYLVALTFLLYVIYDVVRRPMSGDHASTPLILSSAFVIMAVAFRVSRYLILTKRAKKQVVSNQEHVIVLDREGFSVNIKGSQSRIEWRTVQAVEWDRRLIYIYVDSNLAILVNRSAFSTDADADAFAVTADTTHRDAIAHPNRLSVVGPEPEGPSTRVDFQLKTADLKHILDIQAKTTGSRRYLLIIIATIVGLIVGVNLYFNWFTIFVLHDYLDALETTAIPAAFLSLFAFLATNTTNAARTQIKSKIYSSPQSLSLNRESFVWTDSLNSSTISWPRVSDIISKPNGLYVILDNKNVLGVPASAFRSSVERDAFYSRMQAYWKGLDEPLPNENEPAAEVWPPRPR